MATKVIYARGTKAKYKSLASHDEQILYWCTDSRELYKGDDLYSDGVRFAESYAKLPEFSSAANGILYICEDTGNGYVLNEAGDKWEIVIHSVDNETITYNEDGLLSVKAVPIDSVTGLKEKLEGIESSVVSGAPIATAEVAGIVKPNADEFTVGEDGLLTIESVPVEKVNGLKERLENIEAAQVGGVRYMGSVPTVEDLPKDAKQGHLYEIESDNSEWCFNGEKWFEYGHSDGTKPIARADINTDQFEITEDGILNLKAIDAGIVYVGESKLTDVLSALEDATSWHEF